jgi:hypothetical protein
MLLNRPSALCRRKMDAIISPVNAIKPQVTDLNPSDAIGRQ